MTAFAALPTLQKNGLSTTTTTPMTTGSLDVEVTEQAVFYRAGVLLTHGWELGPDNAVEFRTEEVIVSATDGTSGDGTVTFSTRAVKADGTNGPAYPWPIGTRIRNTLSTSVYDQIKDNLDIHETGLSTRISELYSNAIINGDMQIWQRGTTFTPSASTKTFTADRWCVYRTATGYTASQQSSGLPYPAYLLRLQRTAGNTATNAIRAYQQIESKDAVKFAGQYITVQVTGKAGADFSGASNALNVLLVGGTGADENYIATFTGAANQINSTATLTTSLQTFTFTTAAVIGATISELALEFNYTPSGTAGAADYFDITSVRVMAGQTALPIMPRRYEQELRLCKRYFMRFNPEALQYATIGMGFGSSTTLAYVITPLQTKMRIAPTVTVFSNIVLNDMATNYDVTALLAYNLFSTPEIVTFQVTVAAGLTAQNAYFLFTKATSGDVFLSAEL